MRRVPARRTTRKWMYFWYPLALLCMLFAQLFGESYSAFAASIPTTSGGSSASQNPPISFPSWLQTPKAVPHTLVGKRATRTAQAVPVGGSVSNSRLAPPVTFTLTTKAQQLLSKDGHFEVDVPAATVSAAQIKAAGGAIRLKIVQQRAASGGQASGHLLFGTYQLQWLRGDGTPLTTLVLAHPLTLRYHLSTQQQSLVWKDQEVDALWQNTSGPAASPSLPSSPASHAVTSGAIATVARTHLPVVWKTKRDPGQTSWSVTTLLPSTTSVTSTTPTPVPTTSTRTTRTTSTPTGIRWKGEPTECDQYQWYK